MTTFKHISVADLKQFTRVEQATILDIRDAHAYQQGHISNAQNLSAEQLPELIANSDKTQPMVVYCYHGISCQQIAQQLVTHGFTDVYSLDGGFTAWQQKTP